MQAPHNSIETMPANQFASINRHPDNAGQKHEEKVNFKPQSTYDNEQGKGKQRVSSDSASTATTKQRAHSRAHRFYLWFTQCCRRGKTKKTASGKSREGCWKRMKRKCGKRKKRIHISEQKDRTPTEESEEVVQKKSRKKHKKHEAVRRSSGSKKPRRNKRSRQWEKVDPSETPTISGHSFQPDQDEKLIREHTLERDLDFTKSCCYLCAKNTLAIAGAISNKTERTHVSIQSSARYLTEDKSCSPEVRVRTVKSSVRVKVRDMSTLHPEKKKSKKTKFKLKFKRPDILPRMRLPIQPKVRTVACETDKSVRNHNLPQCRTKRGTHCVTEKK